MKIKSCQFITRILITLPVSILLISICSCSSSVKFHPSAEELELIKLLTPRTDGGMPLMQALKNRKSTRNLSTKTLPDQVLSNLLWAAFGINRPQSGDRTAPSAVNWQEIDIYVFLKKGIYIYNAKAHALTPIRAGDYRAATTKSFQPNREAIEKAPVNFVYVSDSKKRNVMSVFTRDTEEDYYSAAATGYISQNVYLFCASEKLGSVSRGMLDKELLRKVLGLQDNQKIILAQTVGYPE